MNSAYDKGFSTDEMRLPSRADRICSRKTPGWDRKMAVTGTGGTC